LKDRAEYLVSKSRQDLQYTFTKLDVSGDADLELTPEEVASDIVVFSGSLYRRISVKLPKLEPSRVLVFNNDAKSRFSILLVHPSGSPQWSIEPRKTILLYVTFQGEVNVMPGGDRT